MDNAYFTDLVDKSFIGYKWIGGSGHINRDLITQNRDFIFSAQLFKEHNIKPTIFGIIIDSNIRKINITTEYGIFESIIYDGKGDEKFYYITLNNNVLSSYHFVLNITYENGKTLDCIVLGDRISELLNGSQVYLYKEQLNLIN